ncbi:MAG: hypothetical protein AAF915_26585 [Cyanobacteria bacterium P01_D01_bin.50]
MQSEWQERRYLYTAWRNMKERCSSSWKPNFHRYGGRGIKVCKRWLESFDAFYQDMGKRPSPKHSIERIDNDGDYSPENCKWATPKEQCRNKSNNRYITYQDKTLTITEWSRKTGWSTATINNRIKRGLPLEQVLTQKPTSN